MARYQTQALSCVHALMKLMIRIVTSPKNQTFQIHQTQVLKHNPAVKHSNLAMEVRKPSAIKVVRKRLYQFSEVVLENRRIQV